MSAPDKFGHVTRYSDSSLYDERCTLCGGTDRRGSDALDKPCPNAMTPSTTPVPVEASELRLRRWDIDGSFVTIRHGRPIKDDDKDRLQAAVNAYVNTLAAAPQPVQGMASDHGNLVRRIDDALSDERALTGVACKHGWDRAVCTIKECENPYDLEALLVEARDALATQSPDLAGKGGAG